MLYLLGFAYVAAGIWLFWNAGPLSYGRGLETLFGLVIIAGLITYDGVLYIGFSIDTSYRRQRLRKNDSWLRRHGKVKE